MIIFSLFMVSGMFFYQLLTPPKEVRFVPYNHKKMKFRLKEVKLNG